MPPVVSATASPSSDALARRTMSLIYAERWTRAPSLMYVAERLDHRPSVVLDGADWPVAMLGGGTNPCCCGVGARSGVIFVRSCSGIAPWPCAACAFAEGAECAEEARSLDRSVQAVTPRTTNTANEIAAMRVRLDME
jgi:hypothetical protein